MFVNERENTEMSLLLEMWSKDQHNVKGIFIKLLEILSKHENAIFSFKSRPGVSHSLRAMVKKIDYGDPILFAIVDIIDDDPENRWLSVCFYNKMITDPEKAGNLLPKGLLGEDGYCFDLFEFDDAIISYIEQRINESYIKTTASIHAPGKEPS